MSTSRPHRDATELHRELDAIWGNPPGWRSLSAVNHSTIGLRFIVTGFIFMLVGGLLAMLMRVQLAWPDNVALDPQTYNELVTMHGTTMMFLFAVPIMEGFALYLIPKMLGGRDVPFPRLSAYGYWCYLFGGLILYSSFLFGLAPDGGWFMYTPLTGPEFTPDARADFWLLGVTFVEISAVAAAIEIVVAVLVTRAPGMAIQRMPLFAWYLLATSLMIVFGFPPLIMGSVLLELERAFGFVFYDVNLGGDPLLWQHLFWLFGHPEVYIIFLPAAGVLSTIIPVFAQRPIVGYAWVVLAIAATAFLSFGLWVHHMYAVGIPYLSKSFFAAASLAVTIPMGIQIFIWIATLWTGRPRLEAPMLWVAGFFFVFVLGGLTGVMVAIVPFDWQVHDTHFVVAHLHYVLIGGLMFPMFAAFYYWLPLWTGRLPSMAMARMTFWLVFIGFNLTFLPMHWTGMLGHVRRAYTYSPDLGVDWLNLTSTIGGFILAFGTAAFAVEFVLAWVHGRRAREHNPWRGDSLEWAVPMPAPNYNFASIPLITDRAPMWKDPELPRRVAGGEYYLGFARDGAREMLGCNPVTGQPEQLLRISRSTWLPLYAGLATAGGFIGILAELYWLSVLSVLALVGIAFVSAWTSGDRFAPIRMDVGRGLTLPMQYAAKNAPGWWGIILFLLTDAALFSSLAYGYFYLWLNAPAWPPPELGLPGLAWPAVAAAVLVASAVAMQWMHATLRSDAPSRLRFALALGALLALVATLATSASLLQLPSPGTHAYASVSTTLVGYAALHLAIGFVVNAYALARTLAGLVSAARPLEARIAWAFWQYTAVMSLVALAIVHLFPRLG